MVVREHASHPRYSITAVFWNVAINGFSMCYVKGTELKIQYCSSLLFMQSIIFYLSLIEYAFCFCDITA